MARDGIRSKHRDANNDPVNFTDPDGRLGKQAWKVGDANLAIQNIGWDAAYEAAGTTANMLGLKNGGNSLNARSVKVLHAVADKWEAANRGPMGMVFDRQRV